MDSFVRIVFIRHAHSEANAREDKYIAGRELDAKLTDLGIQQAHALGEYLYRRFPSDLGTIYVSPSVRTMDTCRIAMRRCGVVGGPIVKEHEWIQSQALVELSMGEYEGRLRDEIYTPEVVKIFHNNPYHFKGPGGESQMDVEYRTFNYLMNVVIPTIEQTPSRLALIFSHGFVIKTFITAILSATPTMTTKINLSNAGVSEFIFHKTNGWYVNSINEASHLVDLKR